MTKVKEQNKYAVMVLEEKIDYLSAEINATVNDFPTYQDLCIKGRNQLQSAIKTLQEDKGEVITEGVVGLNKTENSFYLDDFNFKYVVQLIEARINELIGKQVKLILIKKGE